jgi:hypothetical protein
MWRGPGIYEAHLCFEAGGREALDIIAAMQALMIEQYRAKLFWGAVPDENRKTRMFARLGGWRSHGPIVTEAGPSELFVREIG